MSSYHGGKQRIGLEIAENIHLVSTIIEEHTDFVIKGYCEPFCGMLGVYRHIPELFSDNKPRLKYKAGDANESVIKMWQAAQKGWKPADLYTKPEYTALKEKTYPSAEKGFVGHSCTFRGINFGGYFKHKKSKRESHVNNIVQISNIMDSHKVKFSPGSYTQFSNLEGYVIYCDPPYVNSEQRYYNTQGNRMTFDSDTFWKWCRQMADKNIVILSEYSAPSDFIQVFKKKVVLTGLGSRGSSNQADRVESLFMPVKQY